MFFTSVKHVFFKANVEPDLILPYCFPVSSILLYFGRDCCERQKTEIHGIVSRKRKLKLTQIRTHAVNQKGWNVYVFLDYIF